MAIPRPRYQQKKKRRQSTPRGKSKFKRGFYTPINEDKYVQAQDKTMNSQKYPEYRSSWEQAFMRYLDNSKSVSKWSTESIAIPYVSPKDNQVHRYFCDFFFIMNDKKFLVEIKPSTQTKDPVNIAKWNAAREYCKKIGAEFVVVTEKELKAWGLINK